MSNIDPLDYASEVGSRGSLFWGKVDVTAQFVLLKKGQSKRLWVEGDDDDTRRTEVVIFINPLDAMNLTRPVERSIIAESREWTGIVWPSLRELGIKNAREVNGKWAKIELARSGRSYTNSSGATIEGTTIRFHALYDSEADCIAAWEAETGGSQSQAADTASEPAAANDAERATAMQFLPPLVKSANGDRAKLAADIANMPIIAKYFTVDSPEVKVLLEAG